MQNTPQHHPSLRVRTQGCLSFQPLPIIDWVVFPWASAPAFSAFPVHRASIMGGALVESTAVVTVSYAKIPGPQVRMITLYDRVTVQWLSLPNRECSVKPVMWLPWYFWAAVPNLFGTRDWFHGRQFFHGPAGLGDAEWFGDDSSTLHLLCTLYLLLDIRSTWDHQILDSRGWGPLIMRDGCEDEMRWCRHCPR